jgi:hypothetical protein
MATHPISAFDAGSKNAGISETGSRMFSQAENHQNCSKSSQNHRTASKFIFPMHTASYATGK